MSKIQKLTVYLGSSGRCRDVFKDTAKEMGALIGTEGKHLVYGGMDAGLMGIVASSALHGGALVTGIIPKSLKDSERIHPHLSETILVPDLWERKLKMFKRADAIIGLPGGFGTIDEILEVLYWAHLGSHGKPVILVNTENYWDDFMAYLKTLPDLMSGQLHVVNNVADVFTLVNALEPITFSGNADNLPHFEADILAKTNEPLVFDQASVKASYILATALGLKQLDKHNREIGLLNVGGQFDDFLKWVDRAQEEHFITDRCKELFSASESMEGLQHMMHAQKNIHIDLHEEKWGPSETDTHIEVVETE